MSARPLRFVHASDLHIDRPFFGVAEWPSELRGELVDAPLSAAQRVFDAAILHEVDFLLLCGDVLHPGTAGPRAVTFLLKQLERVVDSGIAVYWTHGATEAATQWPAGVRLPDQVHFFPDNQVVELAHHRNDEPVAMIIGTRDQSSPQALRSDSRFVPMSPFRVALAYGRKHTSALERRNIAYWALGGRHQRKDVADLPCPMHYPGTPQGRCPKETGPHGCTLVTVEAHGNVQSQFVETDVVRWHTEHVKLDMGTPVEHLRHLLGERLLELVDHSPHQTLLVSWEVQTPLEVSRYGDSDGIARELVNDLRCEFADVLPRLWTVSVAMIPPSNPSVSWQEQNTILRDFLRLASHYQNQPNKPFSLNKYLSGDLAAHLESAFRLDDSDKRQYVLQQATMFATSMLRAREAA